MKYKYLPLLIPRNVITLIAVFVVGYNSFAQFPQATISNGIIESKLYLPDIETGYYRAMRFDWSGLIYDLQYKGHSFFGQWFKNYDPKVHESVMGPIEEFNSIGFKKGGNSGSFVKIGVGVLEKPVGLKEYSPFIAYKILDSGVWETEVSTDKVAFVHRLKNGDYSYQYKKIVSLPSDKAQMTLQHSFTNTGKKTIVTQVYNHNFFMIDTTAIGPDYSIKFPFKLQGEDDGLGEYARIDKNQIKFIKKLGPNNHAHLPFITGFNSLNVNDYDIIIENKKTGVGVRITADKPMAKLAFWSAEKTVCPEPYIAIEVVPEETFDWTITYDFYLL